MPYRAQLGGLFGSGLYPKQPQQNNAGDIIDAVTRGASTLIASAYARKQAQREQDRQDAQDKLAQRAADRADQHDQWERQTKQDEIQNRNEVQARADAQSGYSRSKTTTQNVVSPGSVTSNGLFGAPGEVTAPSITSQKATIPAAYDFTKSSAYQLEQMRLAGADKTRAERMTDAKTMATFREGLRKNRPGGGSTTDSPMMHADAQNKSKLAATDTRISKLNAERLKVVPATWPSSDGKPPMSVGGDQNRVDAIDAELKTLATRRDSLSTVGDQIGARLTSAAGISTGGSPTIKDAYAGKARKPNGSTIRGGGESPAAAAVVPGAGPTPRQPVKGASTVRIGRTGAVNPTKKDGSTVRTGADPTANEESRLAKLANAAIAAGADPAKVNERLTAQVGKLRAKK